MSDVVIQIQKISKRYKIGTRQRYLALRDVLTQALHAPRQLFRGQSRNGNGRGSDSGYFWALQNIDLDIRQGEIVGLIGRNGAGKTTLLKILSRIARPTSGHAQVRGRVGSLLEVGTGFHTELSGRENVYFYGSILGMRKKEIDRKFDEIVDFAGVERFLNTPLKHYSTGMQSRLAFAVAAHLEPEILLVDEVLAVGDLEFQKKCLGKMEKVSQGGRTVVLVSHQLNQIRRLCQKVVWLDKGEIRSQGPAAEITGAYEAALLSKEHTSRAPSDSAGVKARVVSWNLEVPGEESPYVLKSLDTVRARFSVQVNKPLSMIHAGIALYNAENQLIWGTANNIDSLSPGLFEFVYELKSLPLKPGVYRWRVTMLDEASLLDLWDCSPELIIDTEPLCHPDERWAGLLNIENGFSIYDETGELCDVRAPRGRVWTAISYR
jgi:ABC-type polysaccharide/polyol phosphate transport system ATPase subunit